MKANKLIIVSTLVFSLAMPPSTIAAQKTSIKAAGPSTKTVVNTILSGVGTPSKAVGINGDFYIDTKNLNLYGPKTKGVWKISTSLRAKEVSTSTNIVSEAVATGATGAKGEKGATGDKGPQGPAGLTGARGEVGAQGAAGAAGARGEAGIAGSAGATGPAGARGEAGATGPAGATGARGEAGATGATGPAGARGEVGATGPAGARGEAGAPGSTGAQGPEGAPGVSYTKFATVPNETLAITGSGNSTTHVFFTAPTAGSYTFQVIVAGVANFNDFFSLNAEIVIGNFAIPNQFAIVSDAESFANRVSGRQYGFTVIGASADVSAGAIFALKITNRTAVSGGTSITFSGRALVNKVGSIG